jgi:hypothetical protein
VASPLNAASKQDTLGVRERLPLYLGYGAYLTLAADRRFTQADHDRAGARWMIMVSMLTVS